MSQPASLVQYARTKIVATVGPACSTVDMLARLIQAGVSVFRINTAHGTREERDQKLAAIRAASQHVGRPVAVLVDLAGPKIRLGELFVDPTVCEVGEEYRFVRGTKSSAADELTSTYESLISELSVGDQVMLADGTVSMVVVGKKNGDVRCQVTGGARSAAARASTCLARS